MHVSLLGTAVCSMHVSQASSASYAGSLQLGEGIVDASGRCCKPSTHAFRYAHGSKYYKRRLNAVLACTTYVAYAHVPNVGDSMLPGSEQMVA